MRKKICFLAISLSLIAGYLFVLADASGPTPPWGTWASIYDYETTSNGFNLTAYVAHNITKAAGTLWNYTSYHWASATGPTNTNFGVEFNRNGTQIHYQTNHRINGDGLDINPDGGVWVYEMTSGTIQVQKNTTVSSYTSIWSPSRISDDEAYALISNTTPNW